MVHWQAAKGDVDAGSVIAEISSQMNATEATSAQSSLHENQVLKQADLEAKQREEKRAMEQQLDDELHRENREVENSIEQQKKLVCTCISAELIGFWNPSNLSFYDGSLTYTAIWYVLLDLQSSEVILQCLWIIPASNF